MQEFFCAGILMNFYGFQIAILNETSWDDEWQKQRSRTNRTESFADQAVRRSVGRRMKVKLTPFFDKSVNINIFQEHFSLNRIIF